MGRVGGGVGGEGEWHTIKYHMQIFDVEIEKMVGSYFHKNSLHIIQNIHAVHIS